MLIGNVFTNKPTSNSVTKLSYESADFDYTNRLLEQNLWMEDSYFNIVREHMMVTHLALKDDNVDILQEGFSDFMRSAGEFFKNLLEKFKEFMSRVFMYIYAYMGNFEKFLMKYKDKLHSLNPDFNISGYDYSFSTGVPNLEKVKHIVMDYNNQLNEVQKQTKRDIVATRAEVLSADRMNSIRSYTLGQATPISKEEFLSASKKSYRNGASSTTDKHIDKSRLIRAIDDYPNIKKLKKECEKEKNDVIDLIESLKDFFNKSTSVHYKGENKTIYVNSAELNADGTAVNKGTQTELNYSIDRVEIINLFYNIKFAEAKEIGAIATTAITEKVNALKEYLKFTQDIIRESLGFKESPQEGGTK